MRAHFQTRQLFSALQIASGVVGSREIKPILRNVKLIAEQGRCSLLATNLETGICIKIGDVTVEEEGAALVPSARLLSILREAVEETVYLDIDVAHCLVRFSASEFEMPSEDPANYPEPPGFTEENHHEIRAGNLREMIHRTVFAAAVESSRYKMAGNLWELEGNKATLVATDGRRLALAEGPATSCGDHRTNGQTPVVPTKAMNLLERILHDPEEVVHVCIRANDALFRTERVTLTSLLVEGRYPAYREVLPKKTTTKITLTVGPLLAAVKQAAIMADDESRRVVFTFDKNQLTLHAEGTQAGKAKVDLPVDYAGTKIDIPLDPRFLTEMLRTLDPGAEVTVGWTDAQHPILFRCGDDYRHLVMPLTA